jgi:hypothetical protein
MQDWSLGNGLSCRVFTICQPMLPRIDTFDGSCIRNIERAEQTIEALGFTNA